MFSFDTIFRPVSVYSATVTQVDTRLLSLNSLNKSILLFYLYTKCPVNLMLISCHKAQESAT